MMNDKLIDFISTILAYFIIGYIFISWFSAIFLLFYEFLIVPTIKAIFPYDTASYNTFVQQINLLNISPSEKAIYLNEAKSEYQTVLQLNQLFTPIPINQFIKDELILIVPPAILLGLIAYKSKKENEQ